MDEMTLKTFPRNKLEALAMLYVQRNDFANASPRELLDIYNDAYSQLVEYANEKEEINYREI